MKSIVEENIKFSKREVPLAEAGILWCKGYTDKVRLLAHRQKDYLTLSSGRPPGLPPWLYGTFNRISEMV
jgi:hypothetical protein